MSNVAETEHSTWLSDLIRQLVAYSSIFGAMSYFFGRSYFKGYFDALGIDISFIDLPVYEYLEKGWLFLWRSGLILIMTFAYVLFALIIYNLFVSIFNEWVKKHKKAYLISIFMIATVILILINLTAPLNFFRSLTSLGRLGLVATIMILILLIFLFRKSIKKKFSAWIDLINSDAHRLKKVDSLLQTSDKVFLQFILLLVFLFIFYSSSVNAQDLGHDAGVLYLNTKADIVELTTSAGIFQPTSSTASASPSTNLRFLYFNNGHYFLSKVDSECKPQEIWIVDESNVISIRMMEPSSNIICPGSTELPELIN
jgi:hypothetical protein